MKFARYLHETQTPEWKKAYIDYRALKKRIAAIRKAQAGSMATSKSPLASTGLPLYYEHSLSEHSEEAELPRPPAIQLRFRDAGISFLSFNNSVSTFQEVDGYLCGESPQPPEPTKCADSLFPHDDGRLSSLSHPVVIADHMSPFNTNRPLSPVSTHLPLHELLPLLPTEETLFFNDLDTELLKVEKFYRDREREMVERNEELLVQLDELYEHKYVHEVNQPSATSDTRWSPALRYVKSKIRRQSRALENVVSKVQQKTRLSKSLDTNDITARSTPTKAFDDFPMKPGSYKSPQQETMHSENYLYAKKKLKKAVVEHYRALEMLNNYRVLNVTGFRKVLKKFEKVSKIHAMQAYMQEKVEPSGFASDKIVAELRRGIEESFSRCFADGDKRRALARLRPTIPNASHYSSILRTGILLGSALPTLGSGLLLVLKQQQHATIPEWEALLFVYGVLFVPVLFTLLVGFNILAWARARINYVFIFELKPKTRLDYREYFEIPALLLSTLCLAFWLSFSEMASFLVHDAKTWPLIWLGFVATVLFFPLPFMFRPTRWWFVKHLGKLLIPGTRRVDFMDFWLGDQTCSMIFFLSNLYFIGCSYTNGFENAFDQCGSSSKKWPYFFLLAALPLLIRVVQSLKRYSESRMVSHLINSGKYGSGAISYLYYYLWKHSGHYLVLWCFFSTFYTVYGSAWDLVVDWSVLRPKARYPLLRTDLLYANHISVYYFAIISNVLLRFAWLLYIPQGHQGPYANLWYFIVAMLEMLRRWQWNFYRLESEHLGNMDQYQVTRHLDLPYQLDNRRWYEEEYKDDSS